MNESLDDLDLRELLDRFDDLEEKRTPVGWTPDDAVMKARVERRILEIVTGEAPVEERRKAMRIPCDMRVDLRTNDRTIAATVLNIGAGGAFVHGAPPLPTGTHVHLRIRSGGEEHCLHVRGQVAWAQDEPVNGVGISFRDQPSPAHERRLRRFVLELLRHCVEEH